METDELCYDASAPVTAEVAAEFQKRGGMILRNVFTAEEMDYFTPALREYITLKREQLTPDEQAYGVSVRKTVFGIADSPPRVREFILSPKLGEVAARIMSVASVRLLHFSGFYKAGGAIPTPWHQDLMYIPLGGEKLVTVWVPLMDLAPETGTLMFAEGSHLHGALDPVSGPPRFRNVRHDTIRRGDVSLHLGWTLHKSMQNRTGINREALAIAYYADGTPIQLKRYTFVDIFMKTYFPGLGHGDPAAGPHNPIVYP